MIFALLIFAIVLLYLWFRVVFGIIGFLASAKKIIDKLSAGR